MCVVKLADILDKKNGLYQLADRLNWDYLTEELGPYYAEGAGRPEIPIRVIVGLHYLKYLEMRVTKALSKILRESLLAIFLWNGNVSTSPTLSSHNPG